PEGIALPPGQMEPVVVAEFLDALVQGPEPPRYPAAAPLEERRLEPGKALEDAPGEEAAERHHLLERMGDGMRHHEVVHEAPAEVLLVGHLDPVEGHGHAEALGLGPEGLVGRVVPRATVHRMIGEDEGDGAELAHAAPSLSAA